MHHEYDLSGGVRSKYVEQYRRGVNVVVLDPDVATVFRESESVNQALRLIMRVAQEHEQRADMEGAEIIEAIRRGLDFAAGPPG
jgi:hypothetical protein